LPASASDREYIEMRHKGKIVRWDDDKGFGFITPHNGGPEVFIHVKAFETRPSLLFCSRLCSRFCLRCVSSAALHALCT